MAGRRHDFWLLDLDGTVVDVDPAYVEETMGRVGDRLGRSFSRREAERLWHEDEAGRDAVLAAHDVDRERFWRTFHETEDPQARAEATYVYDDAATVVPSLSTPVGLVTHNQHSATILDHLDIGDWFDTVVRGGDSVGWKPDPGPLEAAMADLGVDRADSSGAMAGDAPTDVGAARNAGLEAVHVARGASRPAAPLGDRWVRTLTDLEG